MRIYLFILISLALCANSCIHRPEQKNAGQPKIVLIVADDLGYSDLSCYGQEVLNTPILTRWQVNW
jgi:hypothetical protein